MFPVGAQWKVWGNTAFAESTDRQEARCDAGGIDAHTVRHRTRKKGNSATQHGTVAVHVENSVSAWKWGL